MTKVSNFWRLLYCSKSYCTGKMLLFHSNASKSKNMTIFTCSYAGRGIVSFTNLDKHHKQSIEGILVK